MHGIAMVFFVLIPAVPAILGNFVLPLMIGAKDVAFPKINLISWYIFVIGIFVHAAARWSLGGVDTGWTFYTPYSTQASNSNVMLTGIGVFITGFSSILTGVNFMVTIHRMRAPGLTWFRLPLLVWALYATSLVQILGTPVIAITVFMLALERGLGFGIFDPALGGDPVLFQHLFWFYSHPAVYIMILPPMGVISEVIACFSRKSVFGYSFVAFSSLAIAVFGFVVWAHHLFVAGISPYSAMVFSFLSFAVAIPSAVKTFNWTATMYKGAIWWKTPMFYVLRLHGPVPGRRPDRPLPGGARPRRPPARHLLRRGALPLHHGRRRDHGLLRRPALLLAEDHRPDVFRHAGQAVRGARLRRLQPDVLPAVRPRLPGHAAPLPRVSGGVPGVQRAVVGRCHVLAVGYAAAGALLHLFALQGRGGRQQPVGRHRTRMDDAVAAAAREFPGRSRW